MSLLVIGLVIWCCIHLIPVAAIGVRSKLVDQIGPGGYKGLFSISLVIAIVLMVFGWRGAEATPIYTPLSWSQEGTSLLVFIALTLFFGSSLPTNIKRLLRHPQLTGMIVWGLAHLLSNGDIRSVVLFGSMSAWALMTILLINHRDGAWVKPESQPLIADIKVLVIGIVAFTVLLFAHPYISGVNLL